MSRGSSRSSAIWSRPLPQASWTFPILLIRGFYPGSRTYAGTHSHKARLCGNVLVINVEAYKGWKQGDKAGLAFFDISNPTQPKEVAFMEMGGLDTGGTGVHRFSLDRDKKLVYTSASAKGYQGNITMIIDFSDPTKPKEVGRWWAPGQWIAGGEKPTWQGAEVRTHHPNRWGNRLYVPLWGGGFSIVDITDLAKPRTVSHFDYHPTYSYPTHTALPVGHKIAGRDWLVVFDEAVRARDEPSCFHVGIRYHSRDKPGAGRHVPGAGTGEKGSFRRQVRRASTARIYRRG